MLQATPTHEIQIKQIRGKWVLWCYADDTDWQAKWDCMPSLRRKARLVVNGAVVDRWGP